jgi:predicted metal-dependent hydrolase
VEAQLDRLPAPQPVMPGMIVPLGDARLRLDWSSVHPHVPRIIEDSIRIGGPLEGLSARLIRWLKRQALVRLTEESRAVAAKAGVTLSGVGVGDPASRWGSCSSSGAIRYSWRLILAPEFVLKATVAHEVAHRVHMNHSPAFHALAADLLGIDPKPARIWLRAQGVTLHGFGRDY